MSGKVRGARKKAARGVAAASAKADHQQAEDGCHASIPWLGIEFQYRFSNCFRYTNYRSVVRTGHIEDHYTRITETWRTIITNPVDQTVCSGEVPVW